MDHNWPFVATGYSLMFVVLVAYLTWIWLRVRRAERSTPDD